MIFPDERHSTDYWCILIKTTVKHNGDYGAVLATICSMLGFGNISLLILSNILIRCRRVGFVKSFYS